ncbi:MAG: hypothetical protein JO062_11440 [Bryobacterales bacterium]|nr:hypothetical protein [Bryobacterales bacterium]
MLLPLIFVSTLFAQQVGPMQQPTFKDDLLDQLVGFWDLNGMVRGEPVHEHLASDWVLNHQFLRIHRKQLEGPHEQLIYIGYDPVSERYVAHLLDTFGGRGSETLGYGIRSGDKIQFVFEYPSGPYHYTFSWDSKEKSWQFVLESKDRQGHWTTFSTQALKRMKPPGLGRGPQP